MSPPSCRISFTLRVKFVKESAINISWSDRRLEKSCASDREGQRRWGADEWRLFKRRLAALRAAPTLADMEGTPGRCHALTADRKGQFAIDLWSAFRLVFRPDDPVPLLGDGGVDRAQVASIVIEEVVDYHG